MSSEQVRKEDWEEPWTSRLNESTCGEPTRIRLVTHRHIKPEHVDYTIKAFEQVIAGS